MGTYEAEQIGLFVRTSTPLEPIAVELPAAFRRLLRRELPRPARAVLFDVYGTLLVSASGEVGTSNEAAAADPFIAAYELAAGSHQNTDAGKTMAAAYKGAIERSHARSRRRGIAFPEVDIRQVWRSVLEELGADEPAPVDVESLAIAFESVSNPCWTMPAARATLRALRDAGLPLGIVSNAQFYTPRLLKALLGDSVTDLGFEDDLVVYSYETGRAKPDPALFDGPLASLESRGIDSSQTVYVGNDMRNDIAAARSRGCMTVLFAGDRRSLRLRQDDLRLAGVEPDSVIDRLDRLVGICRVAGA